MDQTLYDHLGGRETITTVVDRLYARLLEDGQIAPVFAQVDLARLRRHMTTFLSAALGSELVYAGQDMGVAHAGLAITDEMFDRTVTTWSTSWSSFRCLPSSWESCSTRSRRCAVTSCTGAVAARAPPDRFAPTHLRNNQRPARSDQ